MKSIKMVVTDLDRTLLQSDKTISPITVETMKKLKRNNIRLAIATARPDRTACDYLGIIDGDAAILLNGALVIAEGNIIARNHIPYENARTILQKLKELYPTATLSVEMDDRLYADFDLELDCEYYKIDFHDLPDGAVDKIIIGSTDLSEITRINALLPQKMYAECNSGKFIMIMNQSARKHLGVMKLSEHFNIPLGEILAFGDDHNDIGMLRECGMGVAMADACIEARQAADYITDTCDDNGVSNFLENHLFTNTDFIAG
ncbi:MAG TPA: HAD family hydrolase [Clostridia bacterium]|nr:HAD family hydrolase [Clostridia bacterium]HPQ47295.1 HAD family hydrolase [Clostridia bacterium]HRX41450.1 HAD family hydrolase [Clostridia bacterium]